MTSIETSKSREGSNENNAVDGQLPPHQQPLQTETADERAKRLEDRAAARDQLLGETFDSVHDYIAGELALQDTEWKFLAKSCSFLQGKYERLDGRSEEVCKELAAAEAIIVNDLPQYFAKVDELERNIEALEMVASGLEEYSKVLDLKFLSGSVNDAHPTLTPPASATGSFSTIPSVAH